MWFKRKPLPEPSRNEVFEKITELLKLLEVKISKLDAEVDNIKLRLKKKAFYDTTEAKEEDTKDPFASLRDNQNFNKGSGIGL